MRFFFSLAEDGNICLPPGVGNYLDAWKMLVFIMVPDGRSADHIQNKSYHSHYACSRVRVASLGGWSPHCTHKKGFFSKAPVNKPVCTVSQAMEQVAHGGCATSMLGCFQAQAGGSPEQIWPEADAAVSRRLDQRPPEILSSLIILWSQTTSFANKSSLLNHPCFCFWSVSLTVQKKNFSCSDNRASMSMTERNILYALTCDMCEH